jgi:Family of unknown function (DUF6049)
VRHGLTKARFAVAAALTLGAVTLPGALAPALAATASPVQTASAARITAASQITGKVQTTAKAQTGSPVSVAITGMTPQWATAKSTVTVKGIVSNTSKQSITDLSVRLDASDSAFSSASVLAGYLAQPYQLGGNAVTGEQRISRTLKPGQSAHWTLSFKAKSAGLTTFGVYPLTVQVTAADLAPLDDAYTFLPYVPAKHSKYAKSVPARKQIAWVWPMIDSPLISRPGQRVCSGAQVAALTTSLKPGGRLASLLTAGNQYAAQDQLTWAVDPALLEDVRSLSRCQHAPALAKLASTWLASFKVATKTQPMFATPYADVELTLISQYHAADVQRAIALGRSVAGDILDRDLNSTGDGSQINGVVWPPSGTADFSTLSAVAGKENVQALLLNNDLVASGPGSVFHTANGVGGTARVLLYSNELNSLLGTAANAPGSGFAAAQDYLAETALLAQSHTSGPIIVAPPRRWSPPAGLAADVLARTAQAPWLKPVPLQSLEQRGSNLTLPTASPNAERFSRTVVRQFSAMDGLIKQINAIQATNQHFYLASTALESSAWHGLSKQAQLAHIRTLVKYLRDQQGGVSVHVTSRVILGGLKGTVPILIDNRLDYSVKVRVALRWRQPPGGGLKVSPPAGTGATANVSGLITVPANGQEPVRIRVEASQTGSTLLTVRLVTQTKAPLPTAGAVASVTVQATQFGNVAMIILASVLGLFVIASAVRGARHRDLPPPGDSGATGPPDPDAAQGSAIAPEPDTVVPERSELGTAGTSGL